MAGNFINANSNTDISNTNTTSGVNLSATVIFQIGAGGSGDNDVFSTSFGELAWAITQLKVSAGQKALVTLTNASSNTEVYYVHNDDGNSSLSTSEITPVALLIGVGFEQLTADNFV